MKMQDTMASDDKSARTVGGINCDHCGASNGTDMRFCGDCGLRLWQPCHSCKAQNAVNVTFCGSCGDNLQQQFAKAKSAIQRDIELAKTLCKAGKYYQAIDTLNSLSDHGDTRLQKYSATAAELQSKITAIRAQKAAIIDSVYEDVQQQLEANDYASAWKLMQQIPVGLRNDKMAQTANALAAKIREIEIFSKNVRQAIEAKHFDGLLPTVERLCELCNNEDKLVALRTKLRAREATSQRLTAKLRIRRAVELLNQEEYVGAGEQLSDVADDLNLDEKLRQTADQAQEICWLYHDLQRLPFATPQAVALLKRFQRLRPNAPASKHLAAKFQAGLGKRQSDKRQTFAALGEPRSQIDDLRIFWWTGFANCTVQTEPAEAFKMHPGRFAVAYGLALQGIQSAKIETDLLFDVNKSVLQRLSNRRPKIAGNDAWGIDIGATGLKAVRLIRDKRGDEVQLESAAVIPHSTALTLAADEEHRSTIVAESLARLAETMNVQRAQAIISVSAPKTLGRFFSLPQLKPRKISDAIQYEAKHQIPLPEDAVVFDHHVWPSNARLQEVCLIAAQRDQVKAMLEAFQRSPFQVVGVQSACVALYNASHREFLSVAEGDAKRNPTEVLAVLDIGAESSVFAMMDHGGLRFRNLPFGTFRLTQMLCKKFGCDRERADAMRTRIDANRWVHKVGQVLSSGFADFVNDLERTVSSMTAEIGRPTLLVVTGGGSTQHGCIHSLAGRPPSAPMTEFD